MDEPGGWQQMSWLSSFPFNRAAEFRRLDTGSFNKYQIMMTHCLHCLQGVCALETILEECDKEEADFALSCITLSCFLLSKSGH